MATLHPFRTVPVPDARARLAPAYNAGGPTRPVRMDTRGGTLGPAVIIADFLLGARRAERFRATVGKADHRLGRTRCRTGPNGAATLYVGACRRPRGSA